MGSSSKEPATNPFQQQKKKRKGKAKPSQATSQSSHPAEPLASSQSTTPPTNAPTDAPTDAPAEEPCPNPPQQPPPTSQYQLKVNAMEVAIEQMRESQESLDTTVKRLETNVEKISSSVEVIAKSQTDLQKKFEAFMEVQNATKQAQTAEITTLIEEAMHTHVYPQLNTLLSQTNTRLASLETAAHGTVTTQSTHSTTDTNPYAILDDDMIDPTTVPAAVSGNKHSGSPSRSQHTPPPKRTPRSPPQSPAATPGSPSSTLFSTPQDFSGFTEQSQLSGGSE